MNYIGSKFKLLGEIEAILGRHQVRRDQTFCDVFSGTSIVAQWAKQQGFQVISNDMQGYSYALQMAFVATNAWPDFAKLRRHEPVIAQGLEALRAAHASGPEAVQVGPTFGLASGNPSDLPREALPLLAVLRFLERLPPSKGRFFEQYCEGGEAGRQYFSRENGQACQAVRDALGRWQQAGWLSDEEFHVLLASLLESMDAVANTASVYGAFLKRLKRSARQTLRLKLPVLLPSSLPQRAYQRDAVALLQELASEGELGVLYVDPPYNRRQYHTNYHLLETIARWDLDAFEPVGVTGLRADAEAPSAFTRGSQATQAMATLISQARCRHLLLSYSNEGLISEADLIAMLDAKSPSGVREYKRIPYKRFRADRNHAERHYPHDEVEEFLFYLQVG
ncbi:MAG: DNA adenine methylase [Candidatus Sericytochromatia bacterium]|nr:DNA adenine methylase [Candidatus Sericytochromatia bacterium]